MKFSMNHRKNGPAWMAGIAARVFAVTLGGLLLWGGWSGAALADDAKARGIMQAVNDREDGDNQTMDLEMVLIDSRGNKRVKKLKSFAKDRGKDTLSMVFFLHPADVKGTGFLTHDFNDAGKDDDQWLYLPALRKTKRIASGDKSGSFMGSDLNYSDMTKPDLENFDFTLMKEVDVDGVKTWQIQAVPRKEKTAEETGYSKSVVWVRQDNHVLIRSLRWVHKSNRRKFIQMNQLQKIDGIWVAGEMNVTTKQGNRTLHATVLKRENIRFNQKLLDSFFTVRQLEKGL